MTDDHKQDDWDMSKERAFIENLVGQRFNFFLVLFALVINGYVNAKTQLQLSIVLTVGAIVCSMIAFTLAVGERKLNLILGKLQKDGPRQHPYHEIAAKVRISGRDWIGYIIPIACSVTLVVGAILAWCGCLLVASTNS